MGGEHRSFDDMWGQLQTLTRMAVSDYATLAVGTVAIGFASSSPVLPAKAIGALVSVETDSVRFRSDGTAPTTTEGHILYVGDVLDLTGANFRDFLVDTQFVRVTTDAALKITYVKDSEVD